MDLTEEQLKALHALPMHGWAEFEDGKQAESDYATLLESGLVDVKDKQSGGYSAVQITDLGKTHIRRHMLR